MVGSFSFPKEHLMQNVEVDFLVTDIVQKSDTVYKQLTWTEDRWVIGWGPWIGVNKGNVFEGHLALSHVITSDPEVVTGLFMRGPHKENEAAYDYAQNCDFFPEGTGRLVKAGEPMVLTLHCTDTGSQANYFGVQGSIRIYSVKVPSV
jgi:hypothetical protein